MPPAFTCRFCNKSFTSNSNLKRHLRNVHKTASDNSGQANLCCPQCSVSVTLLEDFVKHCLVAHDISIKNDTLHFENETDFETWKNETERNSKTCFVKKTSDRKRHKNSVCKVRRYYCSRSGFYKPANETRIRGKKTQGSRKINGFCPCGIKVTYLNDGKITAVYCSTHIGHKPDLAHLTLTRKERQSIATKMANKIPFDTILDNVRSTANKQDLDRVNFLTKQDLYNIETEFGINDDSVFHSNDAISVDAWVEEENLSDKSCILLYKPQNKTVHRYSTFKKEDFALGIMTGAQEENLKKYGHDCVCIDRSHGLNAYNFEVVTIMVVDDMGQGFPCAFFICNRIDHETIGTLFYFIKERVGDFCPSVFMSDMADLFYNGWLSVMSPVEKRLYCTWHVDRAWQKNLKKIKDKEKRSIAYKKLRTLLEETDEQAFLAMLQSIIHFLCSDEATKDYGEYFDTYYGQCYRQWAYCYRINSGINTHMHLERMHRTIKHLFLKGKTVQRLHKSIHAIMQMIKQKLFDRQTILEKGKLTTKVRELRSRHKKSLEMNDNVIIENNNVACWEIAVSSSSQVYIVRLVDTNCDCSIKCKHCNACIHRYSCSCIDACINWNMCKHIHLLCQKLKSLQESTAQHDLEMEEFDDDEIETCSLHIDVRKGVEKVVILEEVGRTEISSFEDERMKVVEDFKMLANQMTSVEQLKMAQQAVKALQQKLKLLKAAPSFLK